MQVVLSEWTTWAATPYPWIVIGFLLVIAVILVVTLDSKAIGIIIGVVTIVGSAIVLPLQADEEAHYMKPHKDDVVESLEEHYKIKSISGMDESTFINTGRLFDNSLDPWDATQNNGHIDTINTEEHTYSDCVLTYSNPSRIDDGNHHKFVSNVSLTCQSVDGNDSKHDIKPEK